MRCRNRIQMANYATDIEFDCPSCGENVDTRVFVSPPHWSEDKAIDRMVQEEATLDCPECGNEFDADVTNSDNQIEMTLIDHPETIVRCEMGYDRTPDYDDDWEIPVSPISELRRSIRDALEILEAHGTEFSVGTVNRMVFVSCFAAFEAYLGDTLLKYVFGNDEALKRILKEEAELRSVKIDLLTILTDDEVVFKTVTKRLKTVLWHNLAKVDAIYHIAAKFSIFDDPAHKELLFKALPLRHDCVHRNGRDKEGDLREELVRKFIEDVASAMTVTAEHIEQAIEAQTT